jgi:hypothetical protein
MRLRTATETSSERRYASARRDLDEHFEKADSAEAAQARGIPELYWLWRCHQLQRLMCLHRLRAEHSGAQAEAAEDVISWLQKFTPSHARVERAVPDSFDDSQERETLEWRLRNTDLLQQVVELEKVCNALTEKLEKQEEWGANVEAAVSLLHFEEAVLGGGSALGTIPGGAVPEGALPADLVRLDMQCRSLRSQLAQLDHDARIIEACVAEIEKIGAQSPYSAELHALLARCQSLAMKHAPSVTDFAGGRDEPAF